MLRIAGTHTLFHITFVSLLIAVAALMGGPERVHAIASSDNFNDNATDTAKWWTVIYGTGPSIQETNQRVEVTLPANSANDPQAGGFSAGYVSSCGLNGDFDVQVDYELLTWPSGSGVRAGLSLSPAPNATVHRVGLTWDFTGVPRESYVFSTGDPNYFFVGTADLSGGLRLVRTGGTATGYYRSGSDWVPIGSFAVTQKGVHYTIGAWSHDDRFGDQLTKVAFDNFVVNSKGPSCAVGGIAELPDVVRAPLQRGSSSGPGTGVLASIAAAVAVGGVVLGGAAWYARKRLSG